jgi:hypothetical protein
MAASPQILTDSQRNQNIITICANKAEFQEYVKMRGQSYSPSLLLDKFFSPPYFHLSVHHPKKG